MNIRKGLSYVQEHGDALAQARAAALLDDIPAPLEVLAELEQRQGPSGAWPSAELAESVGATCVALRALSDMQQQKHPMAGQALFFLAGRQDLEGGWPFLPGEELPRLGPRPENAGEAGRIYLTALVSEQLVAYDQAEGPAAQLALDFLLKYQLEGGAFAGFGRQSSCSALPLLANRLGKGSGPAQNILVSLGRQLAEPDWFPSTYARMLRSLLLAGYRLDTPLVRTAWEQILMRQGEDGGWASDLGESDVVETTLDVLWCWKELVSGEKK